MHCTSLFLGAHVLSRVSFIAFSFSLRSFFLCSLQHIQSTSHADSNNFRIKLARDIDR